MASSTYSVVVKIEGNNQVFTEKYMVTLSGSQTIKALKQNWEMFKDDRKKNGWEISDLISDMASLGYEFEAVNEWDEIELNA